MLHRIKSFGRSLFGVKSETDFFGQAGEDAIVWKIVSTILGIKKGSYVDVGAFHPFKHSNTYLLYKAGWRGINVDPRPGTKELFDRYRPGDTNIEAGISAQNGKLTYYILSDDSPMNSFSFENLERLGVADQVTRTLTVPVFRLDDLLERYPVVSEIDYLNVDAEGFEIEILESIDFQKSSPKLISIEQNAVLTLENVLNSGSCEFLTLRGYTPIAKNILLADVSTVFYINNDSMKKYYSANAA